MFGLTPNIGSVSFEHIKHFGLDKAPIIIAIYIQALRNLLRAGSDKQNYDLILLHALCRQTDLVPLAQTQIPGPADVKSGGVL